MSATCPACGHPAHGEREECGVVVGDLTWHGGRACRCIYDVAVCSTHGQPIRSCDRCADANEIARLLVRDDEAKALVAEAARREAAAHARLQRATALLCEAANTLRAYGDKSDLPARLLALAREPQP